MNSVNADLTSTNDFTSLETKSDSRSWRVPSPKLHKLKRGFFFVIGQTEEKENQTTDKIGIQTFVFWFGSERGKFAESVKFR